MKTYDEAQRAAAARVAATADQRQENHAAMQTDVGPLIADAPARVLKRLNRIRSEMASASQAPEREAASELLADLATLEAAVSRAESIGRIEPPPTFATRSAGGPTPSATAGGPARVAPNVLRRAAAAKNETMPPPGFRTRGAPAIPAAAPSPPASSPVTRALERVFHRFAFLDISYLTKGASVEAAVVRIAWQHGGSTSFGTGFLVAPNVMLTNEHVLPELAHAQAARVQFRFAEPVPGSPPAIIETRCAPERLFLTSSMLGKPELDFALVALRDDGMTPPDIAPLPLIEAEGKAVIGDSLSIIQHPGGGFKRVALRNNQLTNVLPEHLHYETSTEPGSSGSPVFNDRWEVVGLHHASVPSSDPGSHDGWINEGIRVSVLMSALRTVVSTGGDHPVAITEPQRLLIESVLAYPEYVQSKQMAVTAGESGTVRPDVRPAHRRDSARGVVDLHPDVTVGNASRPLPRDAGVSVTVPLTISVRLGEPSAPSASEPYWATERQPVVEEAPPTRAAASAGAEVEALVERDYARRNGYNAQFLGRAADFSVPLPDVTAYAGALVSGIAGAPADASHELRYYNFSIAMHERRRLALFTAVNIDGRQLWDLGERTRDKWVLDSRLSDAAQIEESFYDGNEFDKGHLVRRLDPVWGRTESRAWLANNDTFHLTNCAPQHQSSNRGRKVWLGLEDYILNSAFAHDLKVSVFAGPVLRDRDPRYRDVQVPREYWKVIAMRSDDVLWASAYRLSQQALLDTMEWESATADTSLEAFRFGEYGTFQVPVAEIEQVTKLSFGPLRDADVLRRTASGPSPEAESSVRRSKPLTRPDDMII